MNQADTQYNELVNDIIRYGYTDEGTEVRARWKDGTPAHTVSLIGRAFRFDNKEVPILTTKRVAWKTAIKEMLWIWQQKSNRVQDLRDMGVNIWNEWELEDGTIGKAYGYQLGKRNREISVSGISKLNLVGSVGSEITLNGDNGNITLSYMVDQVDYLLHELKNNPSSKRHIVTLWNPDELDEMSLTPCVYESQWHVKEGALHLEVRCRSNDLLLGNPFNIFQYNVLQRMIAQVLGYRLGEFIYHIGDAHIYDRHIEAISKQVENPMFKAPELWINPEVKDFYDFTIDDFQLLGYNHGGSINVEVAV